MKNGWWNTVLLNFCGKIFQKWQPKRVFHQWTYKWNDLSVNYELIDVFFRQIMSNRKDPRSGRDSGRWDEQPNFSGLPVSVSSGGFSMDMGGGMGSGFSLPEPIPIHNVQSSSSNSSSWGAAVGESPSSECQYKNQAVLKETQTCSCSICFRITVFAYSCSYGACFWPCPGIETPASGPLHEPWHGRWQQVPASDRGTFS